ncbi:MAG: aromatic acid exporter family protein [Bacilli bacterium]|nr:aromatic acid exporter family protein [Bacilli bacterium]
MKLRLFLLIKMTIGFMAGMLIAMIFDLPYFYTAGVIAVLSLESTRKSSLKSGIIRIINVLLALGLATFLFYLFGFHVWVLFVFVALLIPLSYFFKIDKGIVVSLVLVSQIYLESNLGYSLNAFYIFLIGLGAALILNLYMPKNLSIKQEINDIDQVLNKLIQDIARNKAVSFEEIDRLLSTTYNNIQVELENISIPLITKRLKYVEMRFEQVSILKRIKKTLDSVKPIKEKESILDFLKEFDNNIGEENYAASLAVRLNELFQMFKESSLPESRDKFENRAQLYYVLLEIDQFLNLKLTYHQKTDLYK